MSDGRIIINTEIDNNGATKGLKKLTSITKTAVIGVGVTLLALGAYAVKVGMAFETGMSKVQAISGATAEDMEKLADKAKEMGSTTKFSATESAEALKYMAMAGWKTNDMLEGLPGIMDLAAASGEDLASVSDIVTDALTAFGMKAKESGRFADILAAASSNSNTNVAMLGESFKRVAPLAGAMGYSAEDASIALGLMANAGIKGSLSGTSLKTALVNMVKPTSKMKKVMDKYKLSLKNTDGTMKPLNQVMDELRSNMGGLDESTKAAAAATLFGKESLAGMLAVINASPEDYAKLTDAINGSEGAAEKMAETMQDNLGGQITLLKSALEGLGIEFYESIDNPLKDIVKSANGMVGELSKAFTEGGFSGLVESLGGIFARIITGIATYAPKIIDSAITVIQSFITGIQNNLPAIASSAIKIITSLATGFLALLPQIIGIGLQLIMNLATGIIGAIPQMIPAIIGIILGIVNMITANIGTIVDIGIDLLLALVQGLMDSLPMLLQTVPKVINDLANALYAQLPKILKAGIQILLMLIKGIIGAIPTLISNLPAIIMAIVNVITLFNWASLGKTVITKLGAGVKSMAGSLGSIAKGVAQGAGKAITGIFKGGFGWGKNLISSMGGGLSSMKSFLASSARRVASGALTSIKSAFSGGLNIGKNLIRGIWNGIGNMKSWILGKIGGFAGSIISGIKNVFGVDSPSTIMRDLIGVNLVKGIGVGVDIETPNLEKDINKNMSGLVAKMKGTVDYETARTTARVVAKQGYVNNQNGSSTNDKTSQQANKTITVPVYIEGREVARAVAPYQEELEGYYNGR